MRDLEPFARVEAQHALHYARFKRYIGDYEAAIELGRRATILAPNQQFPPFQQGFNYWYAHQYEAAADIFRGLVDLEPAAATYRLDLALVEASRGNDERALEQLGIAEQLWQGEEVAALRLGQVIFAYGQLDRSKDAVRHFRALDDLDRERPVAAAVWAMANFGTRDYEEAYRRLESAVTKPVAADQLALAELKSNFYGDPILDEPRWQTLRDRIGAF